jgi:hypothetical protein
MLYKLAVATFLAGVSAETCKIVADPAVTSFKTETFGFKGEGVYDIMKSDCGMEIQMRECKGNPPFSSYLSAIGIKSKGHEMIFNQDKCTFDGEECKSGKSGKASGISLVNYNPVKLGTEGMGDYGPGSTGWFLEVGDFVVNVTKTNGILGKVAPGPYMMNVIVNGPEKCTGGSTGLCTESANSLPAASLQSVKEMKMSDDGASSVKPLKKEAGGSLSPNTELDMKFAPTYQPLPKGQTMEGLQGLKCAVVQQFMPTCHLNSTVDVFNFRGVETTINNLGGMGPDFGKKHCIEYANVGKYHGKKLNLVVTNISSVHGDVYQPAHPAWNGVKKGGNMGQISMKTDTQAVFKFTVVDAATNEPVVLPGMVISILDLDQNPKDKKRESVAPYGFDTYTLSNDTEVEVYVNDEGITSFRSTTPGTGSDNPHDPLELTELQKNRAVEFTFSNLDSFELWTQMTMGYKTQKGGNFIFSGPSSIVPACDIEAPPSK